MTIIDYLYANIREYYRANRTYAISGLTCIYGGDIIRDMYTYWLLSHMGYKYVIDKKIERIVYIIGGENIEYYENIHPGFSEIRFPHRRDFDIINTIIRERIMIKPVNGQHIFLFHGAETISKRAMTCIKGIMERYYNNVAIILLSSHRDVRGIAMNLPAPKLEQSRITDIVIRLVADYSLSQVIINAGIVEKLGKDMATILLRADHICDQYRAGNRHITLKYPDPIAECCEMIYNGAGSLSTIREIIAEFHRLGVGHRKMIAYIYKAAPIDIKSRIVAAIAEYEGLLHNVENPDYIVEFILSYIISIRS